MNFFGRGQRGNLKKWKRPFVFADGNVYGVGAGVKARNLINRRLLPWVVRGRSGVWVDRWLGRVDNGTIKASMDEG